MDGDDDIEGMKAVEFEKEEGRHGIESHYLIGIGVKGKARRTAVPGLNPLKGLGVN